jgi:hypothetical protein
MTEFRRMIEQSPPGTLFPREGLLVLLQEKQMDRVTARDGKWVSTKRALELLAGVIDSSRTLRRMAWKWEQEQGLHIMPDVRVKRTSDGVHAHWKFYEPDCQAVRALQAKTNAGPQPSPIDEAGEIARRYLRQSHKR